MEDRVHQPISTKNPNARYLGDRVYAQHDGFQFWLYTFDGYKITNQIALEPEVAASFIAYTKHELGEQ